MNLTLILQHKASQVIRNLVRAIEPAPLYAPRSLPHLASGVAKPLVKDASLGLGGAALAARSAPRPITPFISPEYKAVRPLRVLQVRDHNAPRSSVGRMVISGSMADVCAELDRLAAREASLH